MASACMGDIAILEVALRNRTYRQGALIFLLGLFIIQFVFGVAAVYRGK